MKVIIERDSTVKSWKNRIINCPQVVPYMIPVIVREILNNQDSEDFTMDVVTKEPEDFCNLQIWVRLVKRYDSYSLYEGTYVTEKGDVKNFETAFCNAGLKCTFWKVPQFIGASALASL